MEKIKAQDAINSINGVFGATQILVSECDHITEVIESGDRQEMAKLLLEIDRRADYVRQYLMGYE